jgi:hypothetical protein
MKEKDELHETVRSLKEEKSALELQIIALQDSNTVTLPSRKPQVLLIGTSNIKGIREKKTDERSRNPQSHQIHLRGNTPVRTIL